MLTKSFFLQALRFVVLIVAQVFIFDHILLFGFINPFVYLLFLILFPFKINQQLFLAVAFLLGLSMDFFNNTGGIHAAACLFTAFVRPLVLKYSFGVSYQYNAIKLNQTTLGEKFTYVASLVFIHHFIYFILEIFNFKLVFFILKNTLLTSILTLFLSFLFMVIFSSKKT